MTRQDGPGRWRIAWDGKWRSGFRGTRHIETVADLADVLVTRDADGDAEFIIGRSDAMYPYLDLLVSHDRWYVHFFPAEGQPGAYVDEGDPLAQGTTHLPAGSDLWIDNSMLTDAGTALRAASEFITSCRRPTGVRWFDLL